VIVPSFWYLVFKNIDYIRMGSKPYVTIAVTICTDSWENIGLFGKKQILIGQMEIFEKLVTFTYYINYELYRDTHSFSVGLIFLGLSIIFIPTIILYLLIRIMTNFKENMKKYKKCLLILKMVFIISYFLFVTLFGLSINFFLNLTTFGTFW
jgi:hypothetical protein